MRIEKEVRLLRKDRELRIEEKGYCEARGLITEEDRRLLRGY